MSGLYLTWPPQSGGSNSGIVGSITAQLIGFSIGSMDGLAASQFGAAVSSNSVFMQSASLTAPGVVNRVAQSFSGQKTFAQPIQVSTFGASPVLSDGTGLFTNGSVDLTNQVTGLLPLANMNLSVGSTTGNGPVNPVPMSPNGATLASNSIYLQVSTAAFSGLVTQTGFQTLGGTKQFLSGPIIQGISASSILRVNGSNRVVSASVSLTAEVTGILPAANLPPLSSITGSVSLTNQVSGLLPLSNMNLVVGTLDAAANSNDGATLGSNSLYMQSASGTAPGLVTSSSTQIFGGAKVFANTVTVPGGTANLPSLVLGTSETNTGLYKVAANQVGVTVGGTQQGLWTSGGYTTTTTKATSFLFGGGGGGNLIQTVSTVSAYGFAWPGSMIVGSTSVFTVSSGSGQGSWSPANGVQVKTYTSLGSNSYVTPTGAKALKITVVGGGGGGGACGTGGASNAFGGGGGGGGTCILWLGGPTGSYSVTVGAGGQAGGVVGSTGGTGSASQFGGIVSVNGGGGGGPGGVAAAGAFFGAAAGVGAGSGSIGSGITQGFIFIQGSDGSTGISLSANQGLGGSGGATPFGGGVSGRNSSAGAGPNGYPYGGGGGGAVCLNGSGAANGGVGGSGVVIVEAYFA